MSHNTLVISRDCPALACPDASLDFMIVAYVNQDDKSEAQQHSKPRPNFAKSVATMPR